MEKRSKYSVEFRKDAVRLASARGTRRLTDVAAELGVAPSMIYRWQREFPQPGPAPAQATVDADALRRRVRQLEEENNILKKAAAFFARNQ